MLYKISEEKKKFLPSVGPGVKNIGTEIEEMRKI